METASRKRRKDEEVAMCPKARDRGIEEFNESSPLEVLDYVGREDRIMLPLRLKWLLKRDGGDSGVVQPC